MLTIALVGVAALPALFFYLAFTLGAKYKPLRVVFVGFALFTCLLLLMEVIKNFPLLADMTLPLFTGTIGLLLLYLGIELLLFVDESKQKLDTVSQSKDWRG